MEKKSKVDIAYEHILLELLNLNYRAGDRLIINRIAEECGISDIPVREALRRLQSNGYVQIVPNYGAIAVGLDKDAIVNFVQIKGVLEAFATRLSVDYLSVNDIARLRDINEAMRVACELGNFLEFSELNKEFHMSIYRRIPQKELLNIISDLWSKWSMTKDVFSIAPGITTKSYQEHERILLLIEQRRYADVEQYVRKHKFKAMRSWMHASAGF